MKDHRGWNVRNENWVKPMLNRINTKLLKRSVMKWRSKQANKELRRMNAVSVSLQENISMAWHAGEYVCPAAPLKSKWTMGHDAYHSDRRHGP